MMTARPNILQKSDFLPHQEQSAGILRVLVVEDDRHQRGFLKGRVEALGHRMVEAENGQEALSILHNQQEGIDVVVIDRIMPLVDGVTVVRQMKNNSGCRHIPVIMLAGTGDAHEMREGIEAGVFYYLSKPADPQLFDAVLGAAAREVERRRALDAEMERHRIALGLIQSGKFIFRTLDEAECLSWCIAGCFPDPHRAAPGLAALAINAIEHGNMNIGYEEKSRLIADGRWRNEIERRQAMAPYKDKFAELVVTRRDDGVYAVITDQGAGFDWKRYLTIDPARARDSHGRGIAQANASSFDRIVYNAAGNQVAAFCGWRRPLEW